MDNEELQRLQYPIGHYEPGKNIADAKVAEWIGSLETLPKRLEKLVANLSEEQLETPYRPNGWTVRQTVHHIADSHHNSYMRFKWALTEDKPTIKIYDEKAWSNLFDAKSAPLTLSLNHLSAVHAKLVYLLRKLSPAQLKRVFIYPNTGEQRSLDQNIGHYAWHGNHHYAQIKNVLERRGWT